MMRRILVNHAEARRAAKRDAEFVALTLSGLEEIGAAPDRDVIAVHEALLAFEAIDARAAKVVELRYFGGLEIEEIAELQGTSPATVKRDWTLARAWLRRELGGPQRLGLAGFAAGIAVLLALLLWQAGEIRLGLYILAGLVSVVMVALLLTHALIRLLAPLRRGVGVTWRYGLANLVRRRHASASQVMALGLGLTALLILTLVRGDLLHSWQSTLPQHAPNRFVINIQPDQVQP
ncbi:MAG: ECF-type sigma factor, partial [Sulfurimicrobium sp.]|nr:ECF-type sigma factor [Sulfurimicrobium sp.]